MSEEESPPTPLQNSMNTLGKQLSAYSFVVIFIIVVVGLLQGRKLMVMFNIGVSIFWSWKENKVAGFFVFSQ